MIVRRGLSAAEEALTLRHEFGHRWLTPIGQGALTRARQSVRLWFYEHSAALRVLEEAGVETFAARSPLAGIRLALGYDPLKLGVGDAIVAGWLGGAVYAEHAIVEGDR